jgi:hypothetical protein
MGEVLGKIFGFFFIIIVAICAVVAAVGALLAFIAVNIVPIGLGVVGICVLVLVVMACRRAPAASSPKRRDVYVNAYIAPGTPTLSERQARRRIEEYRDLEARIRVNSNR